MDRAAAEEGRAAAAALGEQKEVFKATYGRPLDWDPLEGKKACRISETTDALASW